MSLLRPNESGFKRWLGTNTPGGKRERPVWGPDASNKRVRVKYRARPRADLPPDEHVTVETMSHEGYWKFIEGPLRIGTAVLVSAETVEDT